MITCYLLITIKAVGLVRMPLVFQVFSQTFWTNENFVLMVALDEKRRDHHRYYKFILKGT